MVAYVPFAQTIGLHLHATESVRIMKRLFCRRKAAVREACSWSDDNGGAAFEHYVPAHVFKVKRN